MNAEKLFGTRDLYEILQLKRDAEILDVKKNYYKLARIYHPDRVTPNQSEEAKAKFNIIHNAYAILSNAEKKKQYDDGTDILFQKTTVAARWEKFLKPIDAVAVEEARKSYQNSKMENKDIAREFVSGKGSLTHLLNNIPFMRIEDENRVIEIIKTLIDEGKIPKMQIKKIRK